MIFKLICKNCNNEFSVKKHSLYLKRKYCSKKCAHLSTRGVHKIFTEEHKRNIGLSQKGRISPFKDKTFEQKYGLERSLEIRKNMSESRLGTKLTEECKKNLSLSLMGHEVSLETRKKISVANDGEKNGMFGKHIPNPNVNKSYEEIYGPERAKELKEKKSKKLKNKSYEDLFGKEEAEIIKQRHSEALSDEKSPSYLGGISNRHYHSDIVFKKEIRTRDNNECLLCGIHREKLKISLDVHHINYIETEDTFENCIALCHSCHQKTNFNRGYWFGMLKNILRDKYGYEYTDNIKIIKYNDKEVKYESQ